MSISFPSADFAPTLSGYTGQGPFRFWCQKVLPIVYDDSLSYYELLGKVVNYLNNVISDVANVETNVDELSTAYNHLQKYVNDNADIIADYVNGLETYMNNYFENLDVSSEIDRKLDSMVSSGVFDAILTPLFEDTAPSLIEAWLEENISPTEPAIDASLSVRGAGADAKIAGHLFGGINTDFNAYTKGFASHNTVILSGNYFIGKTIYYSFDANDGFSGMICTYDSNDNRLASYGKGSSSGVENHYEGSFVVPSNFSYAKVIASQDVNESYITVNYLSLTPNMNSINRKFDKLLSENEENNYILDNLYAENAYGKSVTRGVTISQVLPNKYEINGTSTGVISIIIGTVNVEANKRYFVKLSDRPDSDPLDSIIRVEGNNLAAGFQHNNYFTAPETETCNVRLYIPSGTNVDESITLEIYDSTILNNKQLSDATLSARNNSNFFSDAYATIKARTENLLGYNYVSFSSGIMIDCKEVYVNRGSYQHETVDDSSHWGALVFTTIDKSGNIENKKLEFGGYTGEARDPNLSLDRNHRILLSFPTTYYYNSTPKHYNCIIELDKNLDIVSSLIDIMPDVFSFGNIVQDENNYLYKAGYISYYDPEVVGENRTYDVVKIYKSNVPFNYNTDIASLSFNEIASLSWRDEYPAVYTPTNYQEPTLSIWEDKLVCIIRKGTVGSVIAICNSFTDFSTWSVSPINYSSNLRRIGATGQCKLCAPCMPIVCEKNVIMFGSVIHYDGTAGRDPSMILLDIENAEILDIKPLIVDASNNGYTGVIKLNGSEYGVMWYMSRGNDSILMYRRAVVERELDLTYIK